MDHKRTNADLTPLVEAHIKSILSDSSKPDYASAWDLSKPSPQLAATIDHTLLKPTATKQQIEVLCEEAKEHGFASCCINPIHLATVSASLSSSSISVPCTVIAFPLGALPTSMKVAEAKECVSLGALELDMVISIAHLKNHEYDYVLNDIASVVAAGAEEKVPVKVIIETCLLTDEEKIAACWLSCEAGASFVKTSTGFNGSGATVEDVRLMRKSVGYKEGKVRVKASGGVRNFEQCVEMIRAGAHRIGASAGVEIMKNQTGKEKY